VKIRELHRTVKIRLVETFFGTLLGNMVFPFMVIYFAEHFGATLTGVLMTVNVVIGMIANFYGGYLADKYGRKKVMVYSQIVFLVSFGVMALANSPWFLSPTLTFLMTTVHSIVWGFMGPAGQAMLIDVTTPESRKFVFGLNYWIMNLSFSLAGLVGGTLFQTHRFELLLGMTGLTLVSLLLLLFWIDETYVPSEEKSRAKSKGILQDVVSNYRVVFRDKVFMTYIGAALLLGSIEFQARNYTSVRLADEFGVQSVLGFNVDGVQMFGFLTSENSILVVLTGLLATKLVAKQKEIAVLFWAILVTSLGFAWMNVANGAWALLLAMAVATIGEVCWVPITQALSAELPPKENRSAYMAVEGLRFRGTQIMGSLAVTVGALTSSYFMAFLILLTGAAAFVLFGRVLGVVRSKSYVRGRAAENEAQGG
jgi:DHA1 family multidrug resistance protein B-like MFS transporter